MSAKPFKSARPEPRPSPREVLNVARSHDPTLPPAIMPRAARPAVAPTNAGELVQLNIRVGRGLADWLADRALADGVSQKVWVCRALEKAGAPVEPSDLRDRVVRRRRGTTHDG
jgi:hypothetical protein